MQVESWSADLKDTDADAVVVGVYQNESLSGPAEAADKALGGVLSRAIERKEFTGKRYEALPIVAPVGIEAKHVLLIGLGERGKFDSAAAFRASAVAAKVLAEKPRQTVAYYLGNHWDAPLVQNGVAGAMVGCHGQDIYRAEKKRNPFERLLWTGSDSETVSRGQILGESMNLTRRLVNEPPQEIYPESFAARAAEVAKQCGLECEIWDQPRLEKERCGSLLAVARGSARPPRLVILRYNGAKPQAATLALVGKGVTFDSGGLSLKPTDSMLTMKCDMAGAATVLGAMHAIARMKLPINVVALMGLVENMTGPAAYKLGDVLTAHNGRTIEVHNTDAEGRLVLADVLCVAVETGAAKIIDLATLTGACVVALGTETVGVMTNDQPWCDVVLESARNCGEPAWQLPMFPDVYDELIKGEVADIKNVGDGRWGGAIAAAKFLEQFVADKPWTHLDIAGPAFLDKPKPWLDGGASGCMVRTLVEVARRWPGS